MTRRATANGAQRTSLEGIRADVLVCGASFAGLAVARELRGCGASVLVIDRYEIGERATSACAIPTPWLEAVGAARAARQELAHMRFSTPHGSFRYRLPWSWTAFDYRQLCQLLFEQSNARFETATVKGLGEREGDAIGVQTDRGVLRAPLVVDALGWRRVLGRRDGEDGPLFQPPAAPLSRGLEVHPHGSGEDLDVWIDRSLVRRGYGWRVPAGVEVRVGVGSYAPRDHVRRPTAELASRLALEEVRHQGNWFPHRLRAGTERDVFFVGDSAGHCLPLSGEGIRTALYFGIACGRELRSVLGSAQTRAAALTRYERFCRRHRRLFGLALALQRLLPVLPPRVLTGVLWLFGRRWLRERAFAWYLRQADPSFAHAAPRPPPVAPRSGVRRAQAPSAELPRSAPATTAAPETSCLHAPAGQA